jgi:hypothetical protein
LSALLWCSHDMRDPRRNEKAVTGARNLFVVKAVPRPHLYFLATHHVERGLVVGVNVRLDSHGPSRTLNPVVELDPKPIHVAVASETAGVPLTLTP